MLLHYFTAFKKWWQSPGIVQSRILPFLLNFFLFAFLTLFLHFIWYSFVLHPFSRTAAYEGITQFLTYAVALPAFWFDSQVIKYNVSLSETTLLFGNWGYIAVVESCSGLKQFYQIFFLILFFNGSWKNKLWFIPLALISLYGVNIFRIIGLSVVLVHWPDYWDFIHMWVFRPFYYVLIFAFWVWWMEKFNGSWSFGLGKSVSIHMNE
jgi:exosortase/archaeosortase family protein